MITSSRPSTTRLSGLGHVAAILLLGILMFAAGVWIIWSVLEGNSDDPWEDKAQIGDALNILTAFFTTLAFTAVVLSLRYQQKELRVMLEELQKSDENTKASIDAMRAQAEAIRWQSVAIYRPYVIARLELVNGTLLKLVIENTGKTVAKNLELTTDHTKPYPGWAKDYSVLANAYVFQNKLDTLPPGHRMFFIIATGEAIHKEDPDFKKHPPTFTITARYEFEGAEGAVEETTVIDMRTFQMSFIGELQRDKELKKIREELSGIREQIKRIASKSK